MLIARIAPAKFVSHYQPLAIAVFPNPVLSKHAPWNVKLMLIVRRALRAILAEPLRQEKDVDSEVIGCSL